VRREDDPNDRRRVIVRVIPKRSREIDRLFEFLSAAMTDLGAGYSNRDLATIVDFMTRSDQVLREATLALRRRAPSSDRRARKNPRTRERGGGRDPRPA
jgi:hypothetical protein